MTEKRKKTGGRKKGTPNKAPADVRKLAQNYGVDVIEILADLAYTADTDATRVAACRVLLERGYGKAVQPLSNDEENPLDLPAVVNVTIGT